MIDAWAMVVFAFAWVIPKASDNVPDELESLFCNDEEVNLVGVFVCVYADLGMH